MYTCNKCLQRFRKKTSLNNHINHFHSFSSSNEVIKCSLNPFLDFLNNEKKDLKQNLKNIKRIFFNNYKKRHETQYIENFLIKFSHNVECIKINEINEINAINENDAIILFENGLNLKPFNDKRFQEIKKILSFFKKNKYMYFFENPSNYNTSIIYNKFYDLVDVIFTQKISEKNIWIPGPHFLHLHNKQYLLEQPENKNKLICLNPISSGIGYSVRYPIIKYFEESFEKIDLFIRNEKYNNLKNIISLNENRNTHNLNELSEKKTNLFKNYKFVLIIENNIHYGSITEKLIDALGSLSLPIYFGSEHIETIMPDIFTNGILNGFETTIEDLIYKIKNMTNEEYNLRIENIKKLRYKYLNGFSFENIFNFIGNQLLCSDSKISLND